MVSTLDTPLAQELTDVTVIAEALKILDFKVYDFKAASDRHERDFPLWVEAARLRREGMPYNQSDYDKIIGDHNALVGAPTTFFDHEFVKLYPNVKIVVVALEPDAAVLDTLLRKLQMFVMKHFLARIESGFFGNISAFIELASKGRLEHQGIRQVVRASNLLEIEKFNDWKPLCDFLRVHEPKEPIPSIHNTTTATELRRRSLQAFHKLVNVHNGMIIWGLSGIGIVAGVFIAINLIVKDAREAVMLVFGVCNLLAFWHSAMHRRLREIEPQPSNDTIPVQKPAPVTQQPQPSNNALPTQKLAPGTQQPQARHSKRYNGKYGRGCRNNQSQARSQEEKRSIPPILPGWGNVQADIREDDVAKNRKLMAIAKEHKSERLVLNHTHKETARTYDGLCKVVAVKEERLEWE